MAMLVENFMSSKIRCGIKLSAVSGLWRVQNSSSAMVGPERSHLWATRKFVKSRAFHPRFVLTRCNLRLKKALAHRYLLGSNLDNNITKKQLQIATSQIQIAPNDKLEVLMGNDSSAIGKAAKTFRLTQQKIMKENIVTIPNMLCVTRIALSPVLGYLVLQQNFTWGLGIFVFAGTTDLLDGMIARNFPSQRSMIGSFLDPMADKLLVSVLFLSLTASNLIPVPLTALIIGRDVCLMSAGFYVRYLSLPPPKTLARYFDPTLATAKLSPTFLSKMNTSVQLLLVGSTLAAPVFNFTQHSALHALWYITAGTTIISGLSYVFSRDSFTLLYKNKQQRKRTRKNKMNQGIC